MLKAYTLFWVQSRQALGNLAVLWTLVVADLGLVFMSGFRMPYDLEEFCIAIAWVGWGLGFFLIFEEQTTGSTGFKFPARTFALPVRPPLLFLVVITGRILLSVVHTAICLGYILIDEPPVKLVFALLAVSSIVMYIQAIAFFLVRDTAARAIAKALAVLAMVVLGGLAGHSVMSDGTSRTPLLLVLAFVPGMVLCYVAAREARIGAIPKSTLCVESDPVNPTFKIFSLLFRLPVSQFWSQTWFEFRSTAMWFPVIYLLMVVPMVALPAFTVSGEMDVSELQPIQTAGLGLAIGIGYLWERSNRVALRFTLARPLSEERLGLARATASLLAAIVSLAGVVAILGGTLLIRLLLGDPMLPNDEAPLFLSTFLVSALPLWWAALAAGRIVFFVLPPVMLGLLIIGSIVEVIPYELEGGIYFTILTPTLFCIALYFRKRLATSSNWVWLLGLSMVPVAVLTHAFSESPAILSMHDWAHTYFYPILMGLTFLYFANASRLISKQLRNRLLFLLAAAIPTLAVLMKFQPINSGIVDSSSAAYVAAGLILPFVWFPLLARFQRSG
jgi:hypothetical protein